MNIIFAGSLNLILFPFACIYREDKDATKPHRLDEGDDNFSSSSSSSVKPTHMELPSPADNSVGRSPKSTYSIFKFILIIYFIYFLVLFYIFIFCISVFISIIGCCF